VTDEPVASEPVRVRPYRPRDLDALYQICLLTGRDGDDATALYRDPWLIGHVHAAPYGIFQPSLAFVAEDDAGVGGYVLGALDTLAFEARLERDWWPRLRGRYPQAPADVPPERWTTDQRKADQIHHPWPAEPDLTARYPSHLHIDLVPRLQSGGHGRRLMTTLIGALREQGSPGVHLHVRANNERAVGFYRHLGFTELRSNENYGSITFGMDLR
jgi:ribosomal protein S18 acetylase RimI-like enzyme